MAGRLIQNQLGKENTGMQRSSFIKNLFAVWFAVLSLAYTGMTYADVPLVNIDPSTYVPSFGFNEAHGDGMVGWTFTLLQPTTITQVGWYDDGADGLSRSFQIGLWPSSALSLSMPNSAQLLGAPNSGITVPGGTSATLG
jgi:hypothetical protein